MDRDHYECHLWTVMQSGFDPSRPGVPPGERVVVEPSTPPAANTALGASSNAAASRQGQVNRDYARERAGAANYWRAMEARPHGRGITTS